MQSTSTLLEPVNGRRSRKTIIGTVTTTEAKEHRISYETASWYTMVEVPAGTYEVYLLDCGGITWGMIGYEGLITKEHFVNRLFTASSVHEPTENIGTERRCTAQTYPYILAEAFANDPSFTLAEDYAIGSRTYTSDHDGSERRLYHLIDPSGQQVH